MEANRWDRLSPLTGVVAVVLWVVGSIILFQDEPGSDASPQAIAAHFADNAGRLLVGAFLFMLGSAFFIWFAGTLRAAIARSEGGVGRLAGIVFGGGVATASMLFGLAAPTAAGALQVQNEDRDPSPAAADALSTLGDGFFIAAELMLAGFFFTVGLAALRARAFPAWLGWISLVLAVVALIPPIGWAVAVFAFPLWLLLVSALLWRSAAADFAPTR